MYRRKRGEMYRNAGEKVVKSTENKSKKWIKVRKYRGKSEGKKGIYIGIEISTF